MSMPLTLWRHWDNRLQNTAKLFEEPGWYKCLVYLLISELLDGFLQLSATIGSSFTSYFFLLTPSVSYVREKFLRNPTVKLKAYCRSSGPKEYWSCFLSPLDIAKNVLIVIGMKGEIMCIWIYGCQCTCSNQVWRQTIWSGQESLCQ